LNEGDDATLPDTRPSPSSSSLSGRAANPELGERYDLGAVLGRGGMGEVRLARDTRIDREVAVKLLRTSARDDETVGRFFREARVQGVLEHPAVVPVHDLGIDPKGNPYFVMKRLTGITLADVIASTDREVAVRWPRRQLLARLVDVCLAIEFAHTRGVVHRDLKPANIMLGDFGEAYVLDWGLARVGGESPSFRQVVPISGDGVSETRAGDLLGTPGYMSPEQARGEPVDARTDTFALGCVLCEILIGKPVLPRGLEAISVTLELTEVRPSLHAADVPPELDDLCARATAADRSRRPSARELADRIQAYLDGDRDVARRRELAAEHAVAAERAFAQPTDAARATAMSEAGRALALDPSNALAQQLLSRLLLVVPDTIPAEALAAADEERVEGRRRVLRRAAWGYLAGVPMFALMLTLPVRHAWPLYAAMVITAMMFAFARFLSRQPVTSFNRSQFLFVAAHMIVMSISGVLFGPLLLLPFFIIGSLSAFLAQPSLDRPWAVVVLHLAPLVVMFTLEGLGLVPASFHVEHHALVLESWVFELTPTSFVVIFALSFAVQLASTIDVQGDFRRGNEAAQNQLHATAWHLRQLLPRTKD
jgi:serine/threonine-protein kinase